MFRRIASGTVFMPVAIDDVPIAKLRWQDGHLLLSLSLHDKEGRKVVVINDNELTFSLNAADIRWISNRLEVHHEEYEAAKIEFYPPKEVIVRQGCFVHNRTLVEIDEANGVYFPATGNRFADFSLDASSQSKYLVGIGMGESVIPALFRHKEGCGD